MRVNKHFASALITTAVLFASSANAAPIQSVGQNSAIIKTDFSANFDGLASNDSLDYAEGGLRFTPGKFPAGVVCQVGLCGNHIGFANMSGGIYYHVGTYAEVKGAKDEVFMGFETIVGTGYFTSALHGVWETWLDNTRTGIGSFDAAAGTVIGLYDVKGFDMVRIGTSSASTHTTLDGNGATAIDSVRMQLQSIPAEVPEPGSLALLGLGVAAATFARKRKAAK
ncbi:PEP-CTERM sorting domain-containing protein [Massilia sp. Leaf139]|uniref:PEP-CTERM sorting domain-containing protein n=1 Tax=Massilia sp. Leaf139 TaxID=1736272 RepID=UPI000ABADC0C|nr:PEP-CTERM sorting domain-containing protein [Massilia sp. Leaf139]